MRIKKVAVLGAGVMGAQIAAHLANVGIPSLLLDIVPKEPTPDEAKKGLTLESKAVRNRFAVGALQKLAQLKPSPVYTKEAIELIQPGNFEDDLAKIADCDWVVEAIVENLAIKQDLWKRVAAFWKPGMIVSSNTSGISIDKMSEGLPAAFRSHFLGTHFFNPPRYMKLLELIPLPETDPGILAFMTEFAERTLGKGVVLAKDTPNFIANRIGTYGMMVTLHAMQQMELGADEVDAITGPVIGRPKSATFRTLDVVGLDTFVHVANNCKATITDPQEAAVFAVPESLNEMVKRGWLGQKSGQGFFKKDGENILTLDLNSLEYRPRKKGNFPSLEAAKPLTELTQRIKTIAYADDRAGKFLWEVLKQTLLYSAEKLGEIADDVVAVDNAMKWGFNWELGPFETWDAIGVAKSVARMEAEGATVPAFVKAAAEAGGFYKREPEATFHFIKGEYQPIKANERIIDINALRAQGRVIKTNKGASLLDMGDGVLLLETHAPKTALGPDVITMVRHANEILATQEKWKGLVIGAQTENFCVGANLMLMLMEAQDEEWDEIEIMARQFQTAFMNLKYGPKPVVAAPYGLTLGGGFELAAASDMIVAAAESYIGLVEVGAGLIPGAGGNKELLIRALEGLPASGGGLGGAAQMAAGTGLDLQPIVNKVFETIGMAKVSTSAHEARGLGYLTKKDRIVVNKDHQLYEAKQAVLELATNYVQPQPSLIPVLGPSGRAVLELGLYNMKLSGWASEHDCFIGKKLAYVLTGGKVPGGTYVTEQYLLDLEREAFLSLCGEKKSQERMAYILKTGKPLRN
ncbi:MAG TPA: 3-hydroxyacyl-CoA dehydrogenase NAD-binding domain-containing protein [Symbiobacteriaceae bacterium]|nr:3-hydroxyacyl-CoA dehydrogenase NAD-binding domain-containing protein [Symbiobacteriaceae bacterium]